MYNTIELPCFGIKVYLEKDGGGGSIETALHENPTDNSPEEIESCAEYNMAMDGIESLILALAIAGVDITTPAFLEGIESAVQGCASNI